MEKWVKCFGMVLFLILALGCGKSNGLEGKVVDGKGKPLANLKLIALQYQPIKGYEKFETTTDSDGSFTFKGLFPTAKYVLFPANLDTAPLMIVESGPKGVTKLLPFNLVIRFTKAKNGIITDSKTGLQWYVRPDRATNWDQARAWVAGLKVGGGGWRMPTREELKSLYQKGGGKRNMNPLFETTGWWVWSGEIRGASWAWYFNFRDGAEDWLTPDYSDNLRVFAVRSRR